MQLICAHDDCFGCSLCHDVCPVQAIEMKNDSGWYRPYINEDKCIDCGKCQRSCPVNHQKEIPKNLHLPRECYAAWCKDDIRHFHSSSGGLATKIAEKFIVQGGVVVGVIYDAERQEAVHMITDDLEDLPKLAKSKYMQSNKTGLWREIIAKAGNRPMLFFGVGCEVNVFKTLIPVDKKQNLFCIDLLCHGGSSSLLFKEHLQEVAPHKTVNNVTFRGGPEDCRFTVYEQGKVIYQEGQFEDVYFSEFMRHSIFAPRCYECPFARTERGGDLTLADFWGLDKNVLAKAEGKGTNLCLVNTDKGQQLLDMIRDDIHIFSRPLAEAVAGNETLQMPTAKPKGREELWQLIPQIGFERAARQVYGDYYRKVCLRKMKAGLIRRLPAPIYKTLKWLKGRLK